MKTAVLSIDVNLRDSDGQYGNLKDLKIGHMTLLTPDDSFIVVSRDFFGERTVECFLDNLDSIHMPNDMTVSMEVAETEISMVQRMFNYIHLNDIKRIVFWNMAFDVPVILNAIERGKLKPEDVLPSLGDTNKTVYFQADEQKASRFQVHPADRKIMFVAGSEIQYLQGMNLARLQPLTSNAESYRLSTLVDQYTGFLNPIVLPVDVSQESHLKWHIEMQKNHMYTYLAHSLFTVYGFFELDKVLHLTDQIVNKSIDTKVNQREIKMKLQENKIIEYLAKIRKLIEDAAKEGIVIVPEMEASKDIMELRSTEQYCIGNWTDITEGVQHPHFSTIKKLRAWSVMTVNAENKEHEAYVPNLKWPKNPDVLVDVGIDYYVELELVSNHVVEGDENPVCLYAVGKRNIAGTHNRYVIGGLTHRDDPEDTLQPQPAKYIDFQNGNPLAFGYNGWTIEQLLAACVHRLKGYQSGRFACDDNQNALELIEASIGHLNQRTIDRIARQVKNTDNT